MASPLPPKHISIALFVGVLMVASAWVVKSDTTANQAVIGNEPDVVQVTRPDVRPYIDIVDSDGNGVPDWQEALQNTEALTVTDADTDYEAPDTLTGKFALEFFEQYMRGEQYGAFGASHEELVTRSADALAEQAKDQPITRAQITINPNTDTATLAAYGEQVAVIINRHSRDDTEQELEIMNRAIRLNDKAELEKLNPIITVYENILAETLQLPVPAAVATDHLILLNAYHAIINDLKAMQIAFDDPMRAMLRLQRYQDDATGLNNAVVRLYESLLAAGVTWESNSAVYTLIEIS